MRKTISCLLALCLLFSAVPAAGAGDSIPSPTEAYNIMKDFSTKEGYREDDPWDDSNHSYEWKGGANGFPNKGTGCVAFAYELSDAVFGSLQARMLVKGTFSLSDVRAGDILRVTNAHSVIVLRVFNDSVEVAEGNLHLNGKAGAVHWGRILSKADVENSVNLLTRYPEGYVDPDDPNADKTFDGDVIPNSGLKWNLTNAGTLTISGSGAMPDFENASACPWNKYANRILEIVIEDGVTTIGSFAFTNCGGYNIQISNTVTAIGNYAFQNAKYVSIDIPDGVTTIGENAFKGCRNLTEIHLPASITSVGSGAFFSCDAMKSAVFAPSTNTVQMGDAIFMECFRLSSVTLPQKMTRIGENMFMNCGALTKLTIPAGVEEIGGLAFGSCSSLCSLTIPNTVAYRIGAAAFADCNSLKDIYYGGTEDVWNRISINTQWNPNVTTVHFETSGPEDNTDPTPPTDNTDPTPPTDNTDPTPPTDNTDPTPPTDPVKPPSGGNSSSGRPSAPSVPAGTTETTLKPSVSGGGVSAQVRQETMDRLLSNAAEQSRDEIVLKVDAPDGVSQIKTQLPAPALADMAGKTDLVIETPVGRTTLPKDTLAQLGGDSGTVSLTAAADGENGVTIELRRGEDPVGTLPGGMKLELPLSQPGPGVVAVLVDDSGKETILPKSAVQDDGSIAVLLEQGCASLKLEDRSRSFADADGHWAKDAIAFVSSHALFQGVTEDTFQADAPMSRAMLVTVLYRLERTPAAGNVPFADVPADSYYADAAAWAAKQGIVTGDNAGFSGQRSVTREELAVMLYRYVRHIQGDQGVISGDLPDGEAVSDWAVPAMRWAVSAGILQGDADGTLNPGGTATRGQTAQMLMHFVTQLTR